MNTSSRPRQPDTHGRSSENVGEVGNRTFGEPRMRSKTTAPTSNGNTASRVRPAVTKNADTGFRVRPAATSNGETGFRVRAATTSNGNAGFRDRTATSFSRSEIEGSPSLPESLLTVPRSDDGAIHKKPGLMSEREIAAFRDHVRKREMARLKKQGDGQPEGVSHEAEDQLLDHANILLDRLEDGEDTDPEYYFVFDEDEQDRVKFETNLLKLNDTNTENRYSDHEHGMKGDVDEEGHDGEVGTKRSKTTKTFSEWVHEARDDEFSFAIKKWQLRKGRETGAVPSAAALAGVDAKGKFVPYLAQNENQDEEGMVEVYSFSQHRTLARAFVRWQRYYHRRKRDHAVVEHFALKQRAGIFRQWMKLYRAKRMHRLRSLFQFFDAWVVGVETIKRNKHLDQVGDTFYQMNGLRRGLTQLQTHVRMRKVYYRLNAFAKERARLFLLEKTVYLWKQACELKEMKRTAMRTAELHSHAIRCSKALVILRRHARDQRRTRQVRAISNRFRKQRFLALWRQRLNEAEEYALRLEGASLVYDIRLCQRFFQRWKLFTNRKVHHRVVEELLVRKKKREVIVRFRWHRSENIRARRLNRIAEECFFQKHALSVLTLLIDRVATRNMLLDAQALREVHLYKSSFQQWREYTKRKQRKRFASLKWDRKCKTEAMGRLVDNLITKRRGRSHEEMATIVSRRGLLHKQFVAWADTAREESRHRLGLQAAGTLHEWHLKRRVFGFWYDISREKINMALSFEKIRILKLVQQCMTEWHIIAERWIHYRLVIRRNQLRRAFAGWRRIASEAVCQERAFMVGAIFRRDKLLSTFFSRWEEGVRIARAERQVMTLAIKRARFKLKRKVFLAWQLIAVRAYRKPIILEDARRIYEERLMGRCFHGWVHGSKLSRNIRFHLLNKLSHSTGDEIGKRKRIFFDSADRQLSELYGLCVKRRMFSRWKLVLLNNLYASFHHHHHNKVRKNVKPAQPSPTTNEGQWSGLNYLQFMES